MRSIDLNVDLGEGGNEDAALIALASSANIACGGHAGDDSTMRAALEAALAAGVSIGAHPGYEDREHFGRRALDLPPGEVTALVARQIARLMEIAASLGAEVHHVKPHGALYLQANRDAKLAEAVVEGVRKLLPGTAFYVPPGGELAKAGKGAGLRIVPEGFVDRRYGETGDLLPRNEPGAVIEELTTAIAQAKNIALHQQVTSISGNPIPLPAVTLCVHGDGFHATETLRAVRSALETAGVPIRNPRQFL
jgi:5-oxoprolinase (ATP-hydrolysing) subunit A